MPGVLPTGPVGLSEPPRPAPYADTSSAYIDEPLASAIAASWRRGEAPLWNPANACGTPLLANMQSAPLSPFRLPATLAPRSLRAHDLGYLLRLLAAGTFSLLFLRQRGLSRPAAAAGAAAFALTPYLTLHLPMHHLSVEVLLPALLFAVDRFAATRSRAALLGVAFTSWAAVVGGNPQATMMLFGFAGALALLDARRLGRAVLVRAGAAAALGIVAAAPYLLPAIEYLRHATHLHAAGAGLDHFRARTLPGALVPNLYPPDGPAGAVNPYAPFGVGLAVSLFALLGARRDRRLPALGLAALALLYLAKAFGLRGLNEAVAAIPLLGETRLYKYGAAPFAFAVACLAALGVERVSRGWEARGGSRAATRAAALAALAIGLELALAIPSTRPLRTPPFAEAPYLRFLRDAAGPFRTFGVLGALPPNVNSAFGVEDVRVHEALLDRRSLLFIRRLLNPNVADPIFDGSDVGEHGRAEYEAELARIARFQVNRMAEERLRGDPEILDLGDEARARGFDLANVRFVLFAPAQFEAARALALRRGDRYRVAHDPGSSDRDLLVLENLRALPRAWLVGSARVVTTAEAAADALASPEFDPRIEVVLEAGEPTAGALDDASVRFVLRAPRESKLEVVASAEAWLVVSETFFPGWRAEIDGAPAPIQAANVSQRAVRVPAGRHEVRFVYAPRSWTGGLLVAAIAVGVGVWLLFRLGGKGA